MSLSDAVCRSLKPSARLYKRSDGEGLQFWVQPNNSKLWRLAYRFGGKQKSLSLGIYPVVTLADARKGRDQAKKLLAKGIDPSVARKTTKANTFQNVAEEYMDQQRKKERAASTLKKLEWLLSFAYPFLGAKPIADIRPPEVLDVLRKVESRGRYETACRLRSIIGSIFRFAIATGRAEIDPTSSLRGTLAKPAPKHRPAITNPNAFGALLGAIDGFDGQPTTLAGLKLMALLFPRPGELRAAEWSEFDLDAAVWAIPAQRTKMRRIHRVPLSKQAIVVLKELEQVTGNGRLVFPSVRTGLKPISENTLNAALRCLGYTKDQATSHGFRASASTLLNESGEWNADAIERQLAHIENNDVRRAYARGEHWDERVRMMQWWADHIDNLKIVGKIIAMAPHRVSPAAG